LGSVRAVIDGYLLFRVRATEGIRLGVVACSQHLGGSVKRMIKALTDGHPRWSVWIAWPLAVVGFIVYLKRKLNVLSTLTGFPSTIVGLKVHA